MKLAISYLVKLSNFKTLTWSWKIIHTGINVEFLKRYNFKFIILGDNYFDQFSTSESGSPLLSRLDVQSKLKPSNSGQSTDSGIVADNDQVKSLFNHNLNKINLFTFL